MEALERSSDTAKRNRGQAEGAQWSAKTLTQCGDQFERTLQLFRLSGSLDQETKRFGDNEPRDRVPDNRNENVVEKVGN